MGYSLSCRYSSQQKSLRCGRCQNKAFLFVAREKDVLPCRIGTDFVLGKKAAAVALSQPSQSRSCEPPINPFRRIVNKPPISSAVIPQAGDYKVGNTRQRLALGSGGGLFFFFWGMPSRSHSKATCMVSFSVASGGRYFLVVSSLNATRKNGLSALLKTDRRS